MHRWEAVRAFGANEWARQMSGSITGVRTDGTNPIPVPQPTPAPPKDPVPSGASDVTDGPAWTGKHSAWTEAFEDHRRNRTRGGWTGALAGPVAAGLGAWAISAAVANAKNITGYARGDMIGGAVAASVFVSLIAGPLIGYWGVRLLDDVDAEQTRIALPVDPEFDTRPVQVTKGMRVAEVRGRNEDGEQVRVGDFRVASVLEDSFTSVADAVKGAEAAMIDSKYGEDGNEDYEGFAVVQDASGAYRVAEVSEPRYLDPRLELDSTYIVGTDPGLRAIVSPSGVYEVASAG